MLVIKLKRTSKNVCSYHEYRKIVNFEEDYKQSWHDWCRFVNNSLKNVIIVNCIHNNLKEF